MAAFPGFIGDSYTSPSATQDTQDTINWFIEMDPTKPEGAPGRMAFYPTPGLTAPKCQLNVAPVRALHTLPGGQIMIAICGLTVYSIDSGFHATMIGTLISSSGPVSIADNGISAMIVDGPDRYFWNYSANPKLFQALPPTDGPFVGGTVVDIVDNFFVYNQPNSNVWGSSSALAVTSPALSQGQKFGSSDNIVSIIVVSREVFLLGEQTTEVDQNIGAFPFPFQVIPGTNTQHGCAAALSVARFGETFAFVSQDTRGQGIIVRMVGYNIKRISTHAVENDLLGQVISDAIAYTYQIEGHEFYVVTFPTADKTWVFDLATEMWHKWLSIDTNNKFHRHRSNCAAVFQGQVIVGDYQNGALYGLSNTTYTDNGLPIRRLRRAQHLIADYHRVIYSEFQIIFQPGTGLVTGQGSDPQCMVRWSDDGGLTYGNEHWQSVGTMGQYKNRARWQNMGQARDRVYEFIVTDPFKCVVVAADLRAQPCAW